MLKAVALANYGLNCGAFELDPRDGELRFRNSLWLCDSEPGPEAMDRWSSVRSICTNDTTRRSCG
jgi:hypothetical protein